MIVRWRWLFFLMSGMHGIHGFMGYDDGQVAFQLVLFPRLLMHDFTSLVNTSKCNFPS